MKKQLIKNCLYVTVNEHSHGFKGDMIQCDSCNEWFHKSCKQIDDKYFDIPDISYYCSDEFCRIKTTYTDRTISLQSNK